MILIIILTKEKIFELDYKYTSCEWHHYWSCVNRYEGLNSLSQRKERSVYKSDKKFAEKTNIYNLYLDTADNLNMSFWKNCLSSKWWRHL